MIKVGIVGCFGRTASHVVKYLINLNHKLGFKLVAGCGINFNYRDIGQACSMKVGIIESNNVYDLCEKSDLIIDFSTNEGLQNILNSIELLEDKVIISGTTNHSLFKQIKDRSSKKNKIFWSANMSISITMMIDIVSNMFKKLSSEEFDVDIIERHHRYKKDIPSGTSLMVAQGIKDKNQSKDFDSIKYYTYDKKIFTRDSRSIYISSNRSGGIIADLDINLTSDYEQINIQHKCLDRVLFASNTMKIASWLVTQNYGFYNMQDFLKNLI